MPLLPEAKNCDISVKKNFRKISSVLGYTGSPIFVGTTLTGLTASRIVATNSSKVLVSLASPLIVAEGGTGLATITDGGLLLGSGTGSITPLARATNGQLPIGITGADPTLATITGTANQITVTNAAGSITLSLPQNYHTGAIPTLAGLILNGTTAIGLDMSGGTFATAVQNWPVTPIIQAAGTQIIKFDDTNYNMLLGSDVFNNDEGQYNVGIGYRAGYYNDTTGEGSEGNFNIYIGRLAGQGALPPTNNTGIYNVAVGNEALKNNSSGASNMAVGTGSLGTNTTGGHNIAIGQVALNRNEGGSYNIGLGSEAGYCNVSGNYNVSIGRSAGKGITGNSYSGNIYIGFGSGEKVTTGSYNSFIGFYSGRNITTGGNNIFIGRQSGWRQTTLSDRLIIDNQDRGSAAAEITDCLMYGVFDATPADQTLRINATLTLPGCSVLGLSSAVFQPNTDSTTFFQVLDANGGTPILNIDTTNEKVGIGTATPDLPLHVESALNNVAKFVSTDNRASIQVSDNDTNTYLGAEAGISWIGHGPAKAATNLNILVNGNVGIGETVPETLTEWTHVQPYLTLHNSTHEDTDGGRESRINFKGEQSGGEETTLARIKVGHDGTGDDEKGKLVISINDGDDGDTPTQVLEIGSDLLATFAGSIVSTNYTAANLLTTCATNAGALDFSAASKTLTVEDNAIVSQDYSSDASPTFAAVILPNAGTIGQAAGPLLTFDDTNNHLRITGCNVVIGPPTTPKTALTIGGTITLREQAAADGDTGAYGQLWVKSDAPNILMFTDDAGNDFTVDVTAA